MSMFSAFLGFLVKGLEVATQIVSKNEHCNLPNLSTWHPVPTGATIPAGTPYAYTHEDNLVVAFGGSTYDITVRDGDKSRYTEKEVSNVVL